ncbi:unnamed protein product [Effrenium voratum]|uniref:Uncharacterized protein n=1 Tax=Effrenium voratum TaxID=2562239 RepID=A0AA36NHH5_9DINO|nr:unnamed protein product [Effrenium voratum]
MLSSLEELQLARIYTRHRTEVTLDKGYTSDQDAGQAGTFVQIMRCQNICMIMTVNRASAQQILPSELSFADTGDGFSNIVAAAQIKAVTLTLTEASSIGSLGEDDTVQGDSVRSTQVPQKLQRWQQQMIDT